MQCYFMNFSWMFSWWCTLSFSRHICYRVYSQMKTGSILILEEHTCQFILGTITILTIPFKADATEEIREWNIHNRSFRIPSSSSRVPGCCLSVYLSIWLTCHSMISGTPVLFFTIRNMFLSLYSLTARITYLLALDEHHTFEMMVNVGKQLWSMPYSFAAFAICHLSASF